MVNQTDKQVDIDEVHSFEVDEYDYICTTNRRQSRSVPLQNPLKQQVPFKSIFSDGNTASLHMMLLDHVRLTSETISYPFRCDTETHCVFLRALVSKSSSSRVGFLNKVLGYEPRPAGTRLSRKFVVENADFTMCSICNRLNNDDQWVEFQQMVECHVWPAAGKTMKCSFDTCTNCVKSISQRIAETRRSYDRKTA